MTPWYSHTEYGYSLRKVVTQFGCSVTTVHRRVRAGGGGDGLVSTGFGRNEDNLTPSLLRASSVDVRVS